jgi:hypothetical protein
MRALILVHRWLGVAFCLLFAMWFASGIVMHFVPFPAFAEADRFAGLAPIDPAGVRYGPAKAVAAGKLGNAVRVRLMQRSDGPVFLVSDSSRTAALHATDLSGAGVHAADLALAIAKDYAARRQWDASEASIAVLASHDQWTVAGQYDRYRPLYRVVLNDASGTELYVSSATGEVVLDTTRRERIWNYAGSVAHWIYPAVLRSHPAMWSRLLWWLSLLALIGASAGAATGTLRLGGGGSRFSSPYRGWQALHHWLGLCCMLFVLTWIFSGWLSMDSGVLFSTGNPADAETAAIAGTPAWNAPPQDEIEHLPAALREVEWFAFGGRIYRRERAALNRQQLFVPASEDAVASDRSFLRQDEIDAAMSDLGRSCDTARVISADDDYAIASNTPGAPVFRAVCGGDWFDVDAANGALLEKLDPSRRAYRWLYSALHTLDFPVLTARPMLRTGLIVALCGLGFVFSLTGVVIAWRRLRSCLWSGPNAV